jgi:hypothetical protein
MDVVAWNMNQRELNWDVLRRGEALDADVHILCEAPRPPRGKNAIGQWRTLGVDVDLPLDKPVKREFSTGIAIRERKPLAWITDARRDRYYGAELPFKPSRPGTWTAGRIKAGKLAVTVIALYGLLDEKSDASMHRSLSELTPIFDHPTYRRHIIMGGDFNIFTNPKPTDPTRSRHKSVLDRINALGLHSCLAENRPKRRQLVGCPCGAPPCTHQRTYLGSKTDQPYEEDYLFCSAALLHKLRSCTVVEGISSSDHAPLKATFDL